MSTAQRAPKGSQDALITLIDAVRKRRAAGLWPLVLQDGPDGLRCGRELGGARDAAMLRAWLTRPRLGHLRSFASALAGSLAALEARFGEILAAPLLRIDNGALVGPLWQEAVAACALASRANVEELLEILHTGFARALATFLERFTRDRSLLAGPGRVRALIAHLEETHGGRQFVIEVRLASGRCWAYKPRPCEAEELLMSAAPGRPRSLFALLNRLRPAAGAPRLPLLRMVRGRGADRAQYAWQEWVQPPPEMRVVRRARAAPSTREHLLRACCLPTRRAEQLWYRAGCLSAACVAVGATDLFADNVRVGTAAGAREPMVVPIDLEMIGFPIEGLRGTGLVGDRGDRGNHHVGFERLARWCTVGGPLACFVEDGGALALRRAREPWSRSVAPALVVDRRGRAGYAPYLPWFLRGLFDCWITIVQRRDALVSFARQRRPPAVRVISRPTAIYAKAIDALLTGGRLSAPKPRWTRDERAQLESLDVPAFSKRPDEALMLRTAQGLQRAVDPHRAGALGEPSPLARRLEQLDLAPLAAAMRDAITFVRDDLDAAALARDSRRLELALSLPEDRRAGAVEVSWREGARALRFSWRGRSLRVDVGPSAKAMEVKRQPGLARRMLRLDRLDASLRERWQNGGFRDRALEQTIERLVAAGVDWLEDVIAEHGFPGHALLGRRAAAAACRLVQHADRAPALQRTYLRLARAAAARGDLDPRHIAYLTDQVRLRAGKPQLYGTKFRRRRGSLEPFPIHDRAQVDERRARVGLPSLADATARARALFGAQLDDVPAEPDRSGGRS